MRLLLTGFEPFGGESVNPAAEVARCIEASPPAGLALDVLILPVRGGAGLEVLAPAFESGGYDGWIGLGQAGGRAAVSVERIGINVLINRDHAEADPTERPIAPEGADAHFATWPAVDLAQHLQRAGIPAVVSNTAGTYICNEVLYGMGHHLATVGREALTGFLHLPYLPEQVASRPGVASMALETQVAGVRAALEFLAGREATR